VSDGSFCKDKGTTASFIDGKDKIHWVLVGGVDDWG